METQHFPGDFYTWRSLGSIVQWLSKQDLETLAAAALRNSSETQILGPNPRADLRFLLNQKLLRWGQRPVFP